MRGSFKRQFWVYRYCVNLCAKLFFFFFKHLGFWFLFTDRENQSILITYAHFLSFFFCWVLIRVVVTTITLDSDFLFCLDLTAENLVQGRLWTQSVSSSTLQQLQLPERRKKRNLLLVANCRWAQCSFQEGRTKRF